jgi:catechol 2,3-dioxygenase-like lactoylglutathione lyase family enzyme
VTATRLNHVHILVRDLPRAIAFYTQAFGLEHRYSSEEDGEELAFLLVPGTEDILTLHARASFESGALLQHFGFRVPGSIEQAEQTAVDAGGTIAGRAGWNPEQVVYVRDPEGNTLEVFAEG